MIGKRCVLRNALLAFTFLSWLLMPVMGFAQSSTEKPNIIWLMAEDMGLDLECYSMAGVKTPNLNQLAREGAIYTRAYCSNPICSPNRSAMMVGVDQTIINAHHHRSNRDVPLAAPFKPITSHLRAGGYTCILGNSLVRSHGVKTDCNFKHEAVGPYDGKQTFGLFDKKADFSPRDQPFFNQIQLQVTHRGDWWNDVRKQSKNPVSVDEIELPPYFADTPEIRYDWACYLDTVQYMDNEVGLLMKRLKETGLDKNTVVIFIADNGRCNLRGKGYLQETGIHVPMIVWGPSYVQAGTVVDDLVCTTDISASVLQLAGVKIPDYITAKPILGVEKPEYRSFVRSARDIWDEVNECSRSITTKRYKYIANHMPEVPWATDQAYLELNRPALHVMRRLKAKGKLSAAEMTFFRDSKPGEELYDLDADSDEMKNLATDPSYAAVLCQMRSLEDKWQSEKVDLGLADLDSRQPEKSLSAVNTRAAVQANQPELWQRLERGELMRTHAWMRKYGRTTPKKQTTPKEKAEPTTNDKPDEMQTQHSNRRKPNFVFFLVDDLGWTDVGCFGSQYHETPNIDSLAASGMRFTQAYAAASVCSPTRASILTGRHPVRVGITDWIPGHREAENLNPKFAHVNDRDNLALSEITLAEHLKQHGYRTFFAGKWHLGSDGHLPTDQGFDINVGGFEAGAPVGGYYSPFKNPKLPDRDQGEYLTERLTDESVSFLKSHDKSKPFLLYLSYYNVHTPIEPYRKRVQHYRQKAKKQFDDAATPIKDRNVQTRSRQDNPAYASMVAAVDDSVGKILNQLDELGITKDTVVVFFSDNGGLSTQANNIRLAPTCNLPLRSGKGWLYEGGIREPMMIRAPGVTQPGSTSDFPVVSMDFFPTLLDLASLELRPELHCDGASLLPLLTGKASIEHDPLYWHYPHYHASEWTPGAAIRDGDWKLIEFYEHDEFELYNLRDDIGESKNLATANPEKANQLRAKLKAWQNSMNASMPVPRKPKPLKK